MSQFLHVSSRADCLVTDPETELWNALLDRNQERFQSLIQYSSGKTITK